MTEEGRELAHQMKRPRAYEDERALLLRRLKELEDQQDYLLEMMSRLNRMVEVSALRKPLSAISRNLGLVEAGEFRAGQGTVGVDFTGIRIFKDGVVYRVAGINNDVLQAYIDSDGKLKAGAGVVILDEDGISIIQGTGDTNRIKWQSGTRTVGSIYCNADPVLAIDYLSLFLGQPSMRDGILSFLMYGADGINTQMDLSANADYLRLVNANLLLATALKAIQFGDSNTALRKDGSGNLSLKDIVAGEVKLINLISFVRADRDGDGDYDPLTSTSWDGDAHSDETGTINWNTVFGVPTAAKAVFLRTMMRDSGAAGSYIYLTAKSTTTNAGFVHRDLIGGDVLSDYTGLVPIAADGTSYYSIDASGANTMDIWIQVVGWYV